MREAYIYTVPPHWHSSFPTEGLVSTKFKWRAQYLCLLSVSVRSLYWLGIYVVFSLDSKQNVAGTVHIFYHFQITLLITHNTRSFLTYIFFLIGHIFTQSFISQITIHNLYKFVSYVTTLIRRYRTGLNLKFYGVFCTKRKLLLLFEVWKKFLGSVSAGVEKFISWI